MAVMTPAEVASRIAPAQATSGSECCTTIRLLPSAPSIVTEAAISELRTTSWIVGIERPRAKGRAPARAAGAAGRLERFKRRIAAHPVSIEARQ
jgi:hypothetical protein